MAQSSWRTLRAIDARIRETRKKLAVAADPQDTRIARPERDKAKLEPTP